VLFYSYENEWLQGMNMLVSFDVVGLFTQVPIEEALKVVARRLQDDETLVERAPISAEDIHALAAICLNTTYFQYLTFMSKLRGAAMGSPLSPIIANIYIEHFEKIAVNSTNLYQKIWRRYVDDTFVIWPHQQLASSNT
jgi:hypothetical protein